MKLIVFRETEIILYYYHYYWRDTKLIPGYGGVEAEMRRTFYESLCETSLKFNTNCKIYVPA